MRKKYQQQINYIFFILATVTALFLVSAFYVWFESRGQNEVPSSVKTLLKFSDKYVLADSTRAYAYEAQLIHDIESLPTLEKAFFSGAVPVPTEQTIKAELLALAEISKEATAENKAHVFSTSYYVGNLLVLPNKTLHEVLLARSRPKTTVLIETALADLRAGLVKIQDFHDVAPPSLYSEASSSALYFTTPSFPSLTVGEAAIVFLVLASLDEAQARLYENQARTYATEVFLTGAHFSADIEEAIHLAELYFAIMQADPAYKLLFREAKAEWVAGDKVVLKPEQLAAPLFKFKQFPYTSKVSITDVKNYDYRVSYSGEELGGSIMLSLVDNRLPDPGLRPYQLTLSDNKVLPFALDLPLLPVLKSSNAFGSFDYQDTNTFTFIAGQKSKNHDLFKSATANLFWKDGDKVIPLAQLGDNFSNLDRAYFIEKEQKLVYSNTALSTDKKILSENIYTAKLLSEQKITVEELAGGASPTVVQDTVFFVKEGKVKAINLIQKTDVKVFGINNYAGELISRRVSYLAEQKILLVTDVIFDQAILIPRTLLGLYSLNWEGETISASPYYQFTVNDAVVQSVALSPAGRFLALGVTEALSLRAPRLLLFDTFDGIIKKEIDLSSFNSNLILQDGWLAF